MIVRAYINFGGINPAGAKLFLEGRGYAGIDNELYGNPKTGMLFADAKDGLSQLVAAVKAL